MPRAFLITHRRYLEDPDKGQSPEHSVGLPENSRSNSSECPEELYNLTKLAEVAVASGQMEQSMEQEFTYTHKLFDKSVRNRPHLANKTESSEAEHECSECGKKYSTSSNLARHRQTHRSPGDKKARRCPHCDKLYVSMPAYSMHVRTHNQGCKCHYCGKCFSRPWLLQGHIRTHTGEKPFKCSICSKAFADKSNLRAHIQTHSNTKPHICGRCGKAFALKSYLYKHEESSCMRMARASREATPDKIASPTPVIVSARLAESVIKGPEPVRSPMIYRSTVISPNPERILYSTIKHPSVILNQRFGFDQLQLQDQPVDFSRNRQDRDRSYVGLAIAV